MSEGLVGHVDEQGWPLLTVQIKGARTEVPLEAVIDTGFDGSLCVPVEVAVQLGLDLIGFQTVAVRAVQMTSDEKLTTATSPSLRPARPVRLRRCVCHRRVRAGSLLGRHDWE